MTWVLLIVGLVLLVIGVTHLITGIATVVQLRMERKNGQSAVSSCNSDK